MEDKSREACELLWRHWQAGQVLRALPEELRPNSRNDGYAIQAGFEGYSAAPRYGWKIAATSSAGQQHIGVDQPLAGRLLAEKVLDDGGNISLAGNRMRVVEPEFAFRFAQDLPPRDTPYGKDDVLAATGAMHLCLELPDSRFEHFAAAGGPSLIADNACAGDLVVGAEVTADWRSLDLPAHKVTGTVGTRYTRDGIGSNVLGDPLAALTWLVNEVSSLRITLARGELITTGTCAIPFEVEPGDAVTADFGILGSISVNILP